LRAFLLAGGRALFLEQESFSGLSLGIELVEHPSTMVFPTALDHPFLAGLGTADLRFWAGDHYVSRLEVQRPTAGGALPLLVSGGAQSLSQAALVDSVYGAGRVVFCQALVGAKLDTEPTARRLLQNLLDALAVPPPVRRPTWVLAEGKDAAGFTQALQSVRVESTAVSERLSAEAPTGAGRACWRRPPAWRPTWPPGGRSTGRRRKRTPLRLCASASAPGRCASCPDRGR
jgi:hypothetical protein